VENVRNLSFKESQEPGTVEVVVESDKDKDIRRDISKALGAAGLPILMMRSLDMTLEEIFLHLTTKEEEVAKV
jgi:ABC-2 type transport system ATP-binding protein